MQAECAFHALCASVLSGAVAYRPHKVRSVWPIAGHRSLLTSLLCASIGCQAGPLCASPAFEAVPIAALQIYRHSSKESIVGAFIWRCPDERAIFFSHTDGEDGDCIVGQRIGNQDRSLIVKSFCRFTQGPHMPTASPHRISIRFRHEQENAQFVLDFSPALGAFCLDDPNADPSFACTPAS